jgi:signal transduction histidine kinase
MAAPGTEALAALDELRLEIGELRASRARLVLAGDAARQSIERALHDGLQQQLVGLAADLELASDAVANDPEAAIGLLAQVKEDLRQALEQARALAHRIHPPLEAGGLAAALRSAAADAGVRTRIDVEAKASLPRELASAVYFSCRDVLERAGAAVTTILVREEPGGVAFEIGADGSLDAVPTSLRDRVEGLGGRLTVRPGSGARTTWDGFLPLSR